ncbi:MAG TPA: histidine kinase [Nitrososphaeraceae archaeon]|nr:histidine kinase [Nitrososphaeraceae archaeon]
MKKEADDISDIIISCLTKNARMSSQQICAELRSRGIRRSARAVLERIKNLEVEGRIGGYTLKPIGKNFEKVVIRLILITFKTSPIFNERVAMFTSYLQTAPFVAFAARTRGDYDWINIKVFPNTKIANQESDTYRTMFGDIIEKYTAFDLTVVRPPAFVQTINYPVQDFYEFLQSWIKVK